MLSAVLRSEIAVKVSIQIMQTFVAMRKTLGNLHGVIQRLESVARLFLEYYNYKKTTMELD